MCKIECKLKRHQRTLSSSETNLHFVGIPSDSQGLVCSSGHGVILNHYHLHSCSLLQGHNQTEAGTRVTWGQKYYSLARVEILPWLKEQLLFFIYHMKTCGGREEIFHISVI